MQQNIMQKLIFKSYIKVLLLCLAIGFSSMSMAQGGGQLVDKIIAKVNNNIILESDLQQRYLEIISQSQTTAPEKDLKCKILEEMIIQKLLVAKAEIDSVIVSDVEVNLQLDRRIDYMLKSVGGEKQQLEKLYGKTMDQIKEDIRDILKEQMTVSKMNGEITSTVKITPKEVRQYFDSIPKDSLPYFSDEVEVGHIVKIPEPTKEQKQKIRQKLEKIRDRLMKGEDFAQLAQEFSQDYVSAKQGGNLGWQTRGVFVPKFEAAVFRLKKNEISKVIETQLGFHVIQLLERRGNEFNTRHIFLKPDYSLVDVGEASHFLDSIRTRIVKDSLKFEVAAKNFSDDKITAGNGGMLTSQATGASMIATNDLDSYLFLTLDTMKVGTITPPQSYRTDDGKTAVRIIYFKKKISGHMAALSKDYQKIYNAALNDKKARAINKWFNKVKGEMFIKIDKAYKDCKVLSSN
ncbi:peptidylprolyl isomerase [uncultured Microscilla sp.]|uniref:peptidylprolyl isomerase n=1 Tax=uncultured Microscilla sp. TaxID=432653 RepID=UPI002632CDE6|nr:peptidylprolyl isomerase [uncultured Microscilla sp.]